MFREAGLGRAGTTVQTAPSIAVHQAERRGVLLKFQATEAELVPIEERIAACRDPKDGKFLEVAVNGDADVIVSGDADVLVLNPFQEIPIVPPATFVQRAART